MTLSGGLSDGLSPKLFNKEQLLKGTKVEFEHTRDLAIAQRIAMDHLTEHPMYYVELEKMENKLEKLKEAIDERARSYSKLP